MLDKQSSGNSSTEQKFFSS